MKKQTLTIGMPAGSLANPNRGGNLITLLENAGFELTAGQLMNYASRKSDCSLWWGWSGLLT